MKRKAPRCTAPLLLACLPALSAACEEGAVRPMGSDHLLYTIERAATEDAPSLKGRKFRLIVKEPGATALDIHPSGAFRVTELSRFEGNVTFNAEVIDEAALYKSESWGRLPRPLTFDVSCKPGTGGTPAVQQAAATPQPAPARPVNTAPSRMLTLTPKEFRNELAANGTVVEAYPQATVESTPLPPVPGPKPEPGALAQPAVKRPVVAREPRSIGQPGGALSEAETARLEIKIDALREEPAEEGKTRLSYELVLRNPLSRGIQCDVEVESFYPRSFMDSEHVTIDRKTHEGIQIRSRGFRTGVMGEILYLPNVLGGSRWMKQNPYAPEKGGLRLNNCVALQG